jgi:hypothetical protein
MDRRQALLDAEPRHARVHIFRALRWRRFDFVRCVRVRCFQFRAMHFRLPLQVRIFVHLVGPHRRVELQPAGDGNDFLAVGDAARSGDARDGNALGLAQIGVAKFGAAARADSVFRVRCPVFRGRKIAGVVTALVFTGLGPRVTSYGLLFRALRTNVNVFAEGNLQRLQHIFFVEAEALAIGNIAHVGAELAVGPQKITDGGEQMLDVIVLLDQRRYVAGCARRGNILERLRGLGIEPHAGDVLRKHRNERKAEALIKIGDELIPRHLFERAVVAEALLERQMPVHVVGIPPGILQSLPEKPCLANPPNLVPPRNHALFAILPHQLAQRMHQLRLQILEPLVVRP